MQFPQLPNFACVGPQTLQKEIQGHQPRIDDILERSKSLLQDESANTSVIRQRLDDLQQLWRQLMEEVARRHGRLEEAHKAQQYYFDAAEAEAWMSEQELYMMSEEKAKVGLMSYTPPCEVSDSTQFQFLPLALPLHRTEVRCLFSLRIQQKWAPKHMTPNASTDTTSAERRVAQLVGTGPVN